MKLKVCAYEKEVKQLLLRGGWPTACTDELRAHMAACRGCADLVLVTASFQRERQTAVSAARIGTPGALWWRAQLRRRNAAVERIARPIMGAHLFALFVCAAVVIAALTDQARHGIAWLTLLEELPHALTVNLSGIWSSMLLDSGWSFLVLLPAIATLALLSGVAVFLAGSGSKNAVHIYACFIDSAAGKSQTMYHSAPGFALIRRNRIKSRSALYGYSEGRADGWQRAQIRCDCSGCGGSWADGGGDGRAARAAGSAAGAQWAAGAEDSYLRRRALQLYELALRAGEFYLGESALCQVGAGALPAAAFY